MPRVIDSVIDHMLVIDRLASRLPVFLPIATFDPVTFSFFSYSLQFLFQPKCLKVNVKETVRTKASCIVSIETQS